MQNTIRRRLNINILQIFKAEYGKISLSKKECSSYVHL